MNNTTTTTRKQWTDNWTAVRVPVKLKAELDELLAEITNHYTQTGQGLPDGANPDKLAVWVAIKKAVDDYRGHKRRSRARPNK